MKSLFRVSVVGFLDVDELDCNGTVEEDGYMDNWCDEDGSYGSKREGGDGWVWTWVVDDGCG